MGHIWPLAVVYRCLAQSLALHINTDVLNYVDMDVDFFLEEVVLLAVSFEISPKH